jgi:hypothetical protein
MPVTQDRAGLMLFMDIREESSKRWIRLESTRRRQASSAAFLQQL